MLTGNSTRWLVIAAALLVALGVLFYPTDEKRVREAAEAIVSAANAGPGELARALDTYARRDVSIDVTELAEPLRGRDAIVAAVGQASQLGQHLHFRIEGVEISIEGNRARVSADLITTLRAEVPELRRPRHSTARFEKHDGKFRLVSAEIGAERLDQPEARP
ncbi:MAG TPA: nuclear transport factor 2 family protein [Polyangiaceae bacterium]|nr:nuclear transport factor 2 family protein [Polyangiaceae bacterium]